MTARNNLKMLDAAESASTESSPLLAWGLIFLALVLAGSALALVWFTGDAWGTTSREAKLGASVWILLLLMTVVLLHLGLLIGGAYRVVGRLFRAELRDRGVSTLPMSAYVRDARLQSLCAELRSIHGWRWRYRTRWLLVSGADASVEDVAPGLKHAGVMPVGNAILIHISPGGIDGATWRRQIRQLRRRRPVDSIVHVTHADAPESEVPRMLASLATDLGWAAPVTFLHAVPVQGDRPERFEAIGAFPGPPLRGAEPVSTLLNQLDTVEWHTADVGVQLCVSPARILYLAQISQYIDQQRERIIALWEGVFASHWRRSPLAGVMFAPVFDTPGALPVPVPVAGECQTKSDVAVAAEPGMQQLMVFQDQPAAMLPVWKTVAARRDIGRRIGLYWPNALAWLVSVGAVAWCGWMTVAFAGNERLMREGRARASAALEAKPQTAVAWRTQLALQQLIAQLEYREQHGVPWYLRGGLSRNDETLAALWQPYRVVSARNLQTPVVNTIGGLLEAAGQTRADSLESQAKRSGTYDGLKTYLMLGDPSSSDPAFLERSLQSLWPSPNEMSTGERDDTGRRLASFYAEHLKSHPEWRITLNDSLVASTRSMLIRQMGLASADDTVYRSIIDEAKGKYADASLETLLAGVDARGLFAASQTVPGVYTRAAWDGMIAAAIDKTSSAQRVSGDWVLVGTEADIGLDDARHTNTNGATASTRSLDSPGVPPRQGASFEVAAPESGAQGAIRAAVEIDEKRSAEAMKERLKSRYFTEYAAAWQGLLNSVRWQPSANLNGAIEQLTRLADAQTSPLVALMNAVQYQAQAGRPSQALTDKIVRKAQSLVGTDNAAENATVNPLDKSFGPLLALVGDTPAAPAATERGNGTMAANVALNGVSLSRYLTAVTTIRLKLQQIAASPDAQSMARALAQAVFQGKLSELSQARDDAALTAASVGKAWSAFGQAAFAQPLEAAWQTILQPAAASLNETWRTGVAMPFNAAMSGRYPFFDTNADASLAEVGRYARPDTGLIARFIATQLAGVLRNDGDHWAPNELAPQALQFDPQFLASIRQLSIVGAQLYVRGDAGERFEIMALPSPVVTHSELTIDGKQIVHFNQRESWTPFEWPGNGLNGHARLTWQTAEAGLRQAFDATGDWAFLRLLAQANVEPLDSTRYRLTWNEANGAALSYVIRTRLGAGPLELLKLRGLRMPERIFIVGKAVAARPETSDPGIPALPPLPPELQS